ncbi:conserved hypothetical protein [Burkholderia cenocepacia PC184]|nr:conserved hypothetical protein [Burkholderia cenocepacia PC184]
MTTSTFLPSYTAFDGHRRLASGPLATVALAVRQAAGDAMPGSILIFDDATGRSIDLDLRGTAEKIRGGRLGVLRTRAGPRTGPKARVSFRAKFTVAAGVTENGSARSPPARRSRCSSSSRTRGARTRRPTGSATRRRARTTSCRRWRAICPVSRKPRGRCMRTMRRGWPS